MKIHAKQVPPEYQESPAFLSCWSDMWPGVIIHGNRDFNSYTTPEFDAIINRFDGEKRILRALHLVTGKRYERRTIRGYCQGDWQTIYYPISDYSRDALDALEIEYFNLGTEWTISDGDDEYNAYCYKSGTEEIRKEIADIAEVNPADVILHQFAGWIRTANYEEV